MKIKQIPEDFIVNEVLKLHVSNGDYNYYLLKKTNRNTMDVVKFLTNRGFKVGFAGLKDKNAVTTQHISVYRKRISFEIDNVEIKYLGSGRKPIYMGQLEGNEFIITIRDLDEKLKDVKEVVNYFGEQRFSKQNVELGRSLVKRDFKDVCKRLELDVQGNDYVNALRAFGLRKLKFFIHAYQSYLWNEVVKGEKGGKLPIFGFLTKDERYDEIIKKESITRKDFIIKQVPELSSEGSERDVLMKIKGFKTLEFCDDELNQGKKKQVVKFFLSKGCYATVVLESLLNNS
jgi:tRNA pseudouridine13 synthase